MARRGDAGHRFATAAGLALVLTTTAAQAQDAPPRLTFDLGSRLTLDDNPDLAAGGSDPRSGLDTDLGLTLNTTTRDQAFSLAVDGLLRLDDEGLAFRDPAVRLSYSREAATSRLALSGVLQQSPVDLFEPLISSDGGVITTDILATTGTITSRSAELTFATGLDGPLGFDLAASTSARDYSDTTDPRIFDSTSSELTLGVHLRMPSAGREIGLSAGTSASDYQNTTQTSRTGRDLTLSYAQDLRPDLRMQATLGQSTTTTREAGTADSTASGATGSLDVTADLPNGTASVTLASDRDAAGSRQSLRFARSLDLPDGSLTASLGLSSRAGQEGQLVGNLSYAQDLATGSFGVTLSRQVSLNALGQDVANTVLGLDYAHDLNEVSRLTLSLDLLQTGSGGSAGVTDAQRQTFTASYSRDLIADWQVTAGYRFRSLDTSTADKAQSNSIFLSINRQFVLRP